MKQRDHLVIRTEAEALRDHARTWVWGFTCGVLLVGTAAFITYMVMR